jgi:hypothetical protein
MAAKRASTSAKTGRGKAVAKTEPKPKAVAKVVAKPAAKPVAKAKRAASALLKPKQDAPKPAADLPAGPTAEQIAAWRALSQEERRALREREAARIFSEAVSAHQKGDLDAAVEGYNRSLFLNPNIAAV